jgi:hypothetical protein
MYKSFLFIRKIRLHLFPDKTFMKKLLLGLTLAFSASISFSQSYIDFGPKCFFGPNVLMNSEIMNSGGKYSMNPASFGFGAGFKLAFDINETFAIAGEINYFSHNQIYEMEVAGLDSINVKYDKEISYTSIEIPIMFRYNTETMSYFEAGYVMSMTSEATETLEGPYAALGSADISDQLTPKMGGLVLGFGSYVWGYNNFGISAGLRVRYDLDDAFANDKTKYANSPNYGTDLAVTGPTNPFSVMLNIEFNYDLGFYMAKSPCTGRRSLIIGNGGGR